MHATAAAVPKVSAYAEQLISRQSAGHAAAGSATTEKEWVGTMEAVSLTGYSERSIRRFCEEGFFVEGEDWKQRPPLPGRSQGGRLLIRRSALKKLEGES